MLNSIAKVNSHNFNYNYHIFQDINIPDLTKLNIVIIDDNIKDIRIVQELLRVVKTNIKFTVLNYTNPHEALTALETYSISPDIIILDLVMPSVNRKMMLRHIKGIARIRNIPVIIHSSMNNYENIIKTSNLEAHAFFAKPLDITAFENFLLGTL